MDVLIPLAIAYLIGSIDFGVIVPRMLGVDIYSVGSGNPGTSNVLRSLGKGPAGLVLLGDGAKGAAAAAIGTMWAGSISSSMSAETLAVACAFAAVLGHIAPIWYRFRGGKGVATAIGAAVYLAPVFGLVLAILWLIVTLAFKVASIASLGAMVLYVPVSLSPAIADGRSFGPQELLCWSSSATSRTSAGWLPVRRERSRIDATPRRHAGRDPGSHAPDGSSRSLSR